MRTYKEIVKNYILIYMYTFIVKVYNYKKVILVRNLHS